MVSVRQVVGVIALLCAVALLVLMAGCGGPAQDTGTETTTIAEESPTDQPEQQTPTDESDGASEKDGDSGPEELFAPLVSCTPCHGEVPSEGEPVNFAGDWSQSMMSAAATDPYFRAKVTTEIEAAPEHEALIESKCLACHMPKGLRQAKHEGETLDFQTVLAGESTHQSLASDGVSCSVCHQVQPERLGTEGSFSGNFSVDTETPQPDRPIFGPFVPVEGEVMKSASGFEPVQAEHMESAALCGSCHTLYTPTLDDSGDVVGSFPEQTPYLEWQESIYTESTPCQSCHMPGADGVSLASSPADLPKRSVSQHQFAGANVQMATLLEQERGANRSQAQLEQYLGVTIQSVNRTGDTLRVDVAVRNGAGHKFPAGFPSRRAWVALRAEAGGETIFESGSVSANGEIKGLDSPYEPHQKTVTSEDQVQVYQSVMKTVDGEVTQTLLRADGYAKDNRIPPAGFEPGTVQGDIAVLGDAAEDGDFQGGKDTVTYVIDSVPAETTTLEVSLLYQPVSKPFLDDQGGSTAETVTSFLDAYEDVNQTTVVDTESETVEP